MKVGGILTVANYCEPTFPDLFKYKIIEISDDSDQDILQHFRDCIKFMEEIIAKDKKPILVHCMAGVSRSASVVIAYIMWKRRISL